MVRSKKGGKPEKHGNTKPRTRKNFKRWSWSTKSDVSKKSSRETEKVSSDKATERSSLTLGRVFSVE